MSGFAQALRSFRMGNLTQDELLSEVYRQLIVEKTSPVALLDILKFQQLAEPLPKDAHESIVARLVNWPQDPTVSTAGPADGAARRTRAAAVGDVIQGRFNLVALIGEGGMSLVYKALDMRKVEAGADDPYVALKILSTPLEDYFGSIAALQAEAHKLQSLNHPHIVRVFDCDRDGQKVFMTMQYLPGESLQKKLRDAKGGAGPKPIDRAVGIVTDVAEALAYAHRNHIVHGDLKPGNVIITSQGEVKVIDFGMARFIARPGATPRGRSTGSTEQKAVTPRYASPEMLAGHDPEPADDVYALACVAYETLTGDHPFGRGGHPQHRDPHGVPTRPTNMSPHRYQAIVRALHYDRQKRTPSVQQFLEEFTGARRRALLRRGIGAAAVFGLVVCGMIYRAQHPTRSDPVAVDAATPPGTVLRDCPTCPLLTVLPTGHYEQGNNDGEGAANASGRQFELPRHPVDIGYVIAMGSNETTVAEYREFAEATHRDQQGCNVYEGEWRFHSRASWREPGFAQSPADPVTCTSWNDATAYAAWLSRKSGHEYRLPSSSEWEYAARAGGGAAVPWAGQPTAACDAANVADQSAAKRYPGWNGFACTDGYVATAPVGTFRANAFGLHDLLGNVFEWVQDCWHDDYTLAPTDGSARVDTRCEERELRGGSWFSSPQYVTASYRNRFAADYRSSSVGFRLVRILQP